MLIHECEAIAVRTFLETVGEVAPAAGLHWCASIATSSEDGQFWRYASRFCIRAGDGLISKEAVVPLFEDGGCVHTRDSLEEALLAAVTETALAVRGPVEFTPSLRPPPASDRLTA